MFMDQFRQPVAQTSQPPMAATLASRLRQIKMMANGDASGFISYLMQTNPQFAHFADGLRGKTPEQAFAELGLDYSQFSNML